MRVTTDERLLEAMRGFLAAARDAEAVGDSEFANILGGFAAFDLWLVVRPLRGEECQRRKPR